VASIRAGIAAAQIESERAAVGAQTGIAQGLLETARIAVEEIERVGAVGREDGGDAAVLGKIETDGNLAEAGGLEIDLNLVVAGLDAALDGDRDLLRDRVERGDRTGLRLGRRLAGRHAARGSRRIGGRLRHHGRRICCVRVRGIVFRGGERLARHRCSEGRIRLRRRRHRDGLGQCGAGGSSQFTGGRVHRGRRRV